MWEHRECWWSWSGPDCLLLQSWKLWQLGWHPPISNHQPCCSHCFSEWEVYWAKWWHALHPWHKQLVHSQPLYVGNNFVRMSRGFFKGSEGPIFKSFSSMAAGSHNSSISIISKFLAILDSILALSFCLHDQNLFVTPGITDTFSQAALQFLLQLQNSIWCPVSGSISPVHRVLPLYAFDPVSCLPRAQFPQNWQVQESSTWLQHGCKRKVLVLVLEAFMLWVLPLSSMSVVQLSRQWQSFNCSFNLTNRSVDSPKGPSIVEFVNRSVLICFLIHVTLFVISSDDRSTLICQES